jgi:hypothetical protein
MTPTRTRAAGHWFPAKKPATRFVSPVDHHFFAFGFATSCVF